MTERTVATGQANLIVFFCVLKNLFIYYKVISPTYNLFAMPYLLCG